MQFDAPNLTYCPHLQLLSEYIRKRIDIMKCLESTSWGASQKVLKMFYKGYILGKIDYGCLFYDSAAETRTKKLDVLQNKALRLILGARSFSPVISLEALCHIPPLKLRRAYLSLDL